MLEDVLDSNAVTRVLANEPHGIGDDRVGDRHDVGRLPGRDPDGGNGSGLRSLSPTIHDLIKQLGGLVADPTAVGNDTRE